MLKGQEITTSERAAWQRGKEARPPSHRCSRNQRRGFDLTAPEKYEQQVGVVDPIAHVPSCSPQHPSCIVPGGSDRSVPMLVAVLQEWELPGAAPSPPYWRGYPRSDPLLLPLRSLSWVCSHSWSSGQARGVGNRSKYAGSAPGRRGGGARRLQALAGNVVLAVEGLTPRHLGFVGNPSKFRAVVPRVWTGIASQSVFVSLRGEATSGSRGDGWGVRHYVYRLKVTTQRRWMLRSPPALQASTWRTTVARVWLGVY